MLSADQGQGGDPVRDFSSSGSGFSEGASEGSASLGSVPIIPQPVRPPVRRSSAQPERLELDAYKLHTLLDFTDIFSQEMNLEHLLDRFRRVIEEALKIERILFYFFLDGKWHLLLNVNCDALLVAELDVERDLGPFRRIRMVDSLTGDLLNALHLDVVIPLQQQGTSRAYVLLGSTEGNQRGISPIVKHLAFAQSLSTVSFIALQNFYYLRDRLRQEEVKQQLRLAGELQALLIPRSDQIPVFPGVEIATLYRPFYEIGGDYFDVVRLDERTLAFCMADISGKGIPASLLMTSFRAQFRALVDREISLVALAVALNREVCDGKLEDSFITFFVGRYRLGSGELEYLNAGHNPPLLWDSQSGSIRWLESNTLPLGILPELAVAACERVPMPLETMLIAYTDGLVEQRVFGQEEYSASMITDKLLEYGSPKALVAAVERDLDALFEGGDREIFDDISLLALMNHRFL